MEIFSKLGGMAPVCEGVLVIGDIFMWPGTLATLCNKF